MIMLTRINKVEQFYLNEDLFEVMEETPDTVITMQSGHKYIVMESAEEVNRRIIEQKHRIFRIPDK